MTTKEAPTASPKAEPKSERIEDQAAELQLISNTVRNNRGVDEAQAKKALQHLMNNPGEDWETKDGTWTLDTSGTPVLLRNAEPLPEGPQEG